MYSQFKGSYSDEKGSQAIGRLIAAIKLYSIDLKVLYDQYANDYSQNISLEQFVVLLKRIDATISDEEIVYAFQKFDIDHSDSITFSEF
jgi:Ca2+-binding EF-hand superfamily protein